MLFKRIIFVLSFGFFSAYIFGQKDTVNVKKVKYNKQVKFDKRSIYNPLAQAKAAFYSAIFPGMGQIYNEKYWKTPIVWGALGTSIYYYLKNNKEYKRYRTAFKLRRNNLVDEFTINGIEIIYIETLERAQDQLRENRDVSLLTTVILYVLQIVEASVNAHLLQFDASDDITIKPTIINNTTTLEPPSVGFSFKYSF